MGRILAIDFGDKRIGFALSDPTGIIAQPLCTVEWKGIDNLVAILQDFISEYVIENIILGIPYTLKGTLSDKTRDVLDIKKKLEKRLQKKIIGEDERLTTQMANRSLHMMGRSPSKSKDKVDQIAAVFILQTYIDRCRNK
jgi:putative Holliday junction resolvase